LPAFAESAQQLFRHSVPCDVVHANFFMSGLVGLKLKQWLRTPLVVSLRALGLVPPRASRARRAGGLPPLRVARMPTRRAPLRRRHRQRASARRAAGRAVLTPHSSPFVLSTLGAQISMMSETDVQF